MSEVKFGANQVNKPTPASLNLWVRVFTVSASAFMAWMATASIMGPNTKDIITQILGLALILSNAIAPFFGVQVSGNVPASEVTAIETSDKN